MDLHKRRHLPPANAAGVNCRNEVVISVEQQGKLDLLILENKKIAFYKAYREIVNCSLGDAIAELGLRYEVLRSQRNSEFTVSNEQYWDGFYS